MAGLRRALVSTIPRILSSNRMTSSTNHNTLCKSVFTSFSRFYSLKQNSESLHIDLSNEESKRRLFNRLLYRSKQRGYLELDLILGKWVEDNIQSMDENGIRSLVHVLDLENPDLWKWLSSQEQPPDELIKNPVFMAVRNKVSKNLDNHASPETRATSGQPWVRGWDDYKKGRDTPITELRIKT